jgi:uncharacterized damage-inducible protein DinB
MSLLDRFVTWFDYELEAHRQTLESLDSVSADARDGSYQEALDLFAHLMVCRRLWLYRLGGASTGPETMEQIFPTGATRSELDRLLAGMEVDWRAYLDGLDHAELGRRFEYRTTEGEVFSNSVEEILTQLYGHAHHHRGQIMSTVRRLGGRPAVTDYVYWTRRSVAPES